MAICLKAWLDNQVSKLQNKITYYFPCMPRGKWDGVSLRSVVTTKYFMCPGGASNLCP